MPCVACYLGRNGCAARLSDDVLDELHTVAEVDREQRDCNGHCDGLYRHLFLPSSLIKEPGERGELSPIWGAASGDS